MRETQTVRVKLGSAVWQVDPTSQRLRSGGSEAGEIDRWRVVAAGGDVGVKPRSAVRQVGLNLAEGSGPVAKKRDRSTVGESPFHNNRHGRFTDSTDRGCCRVADVLVGWLTG
jgi:hypothetical protein